MGIWLSCRRNLHRYRWTINSTLSISYKKIYKKMNSSLYSETNWTASSEFGTYRLCELWRFRRACASAQSRQNLRCSLIQAVSQEEPSDRKPDPWPLWMAGHAQLKFVMTECWKTQIRLTGLNYSVKVFSAPGRIIKSKKISNDQELIQSDSISCPQNQKGNN